MKWLGRILVVLIGLPIGVVVGLLVAGQRKGAGRSVERVDIRRPPAQVFRHLEDEQLVKRWTGLAEITWLTDGGLRPGARSRIVAEARGERTEIEGEVTAVERNRYLTVVLRSASGTPLRFRELLDYRLEGQDGGTHLTVTADIHYEGLLLRLLEPLVTRAAQKQLEVNLDRLKAQVEAEPRVPASSS